MMQRTRLSAMTRPGSEIESFGPKPAAALAWTMLAVVLGLAVRIWFAGTSGVYLDEAQVLALSPRGTLGELVDFLAEHESHPPLYYLLVRGWFTALGPSDAAGIALSIVIGTLLIPTAFALTRRLTGSAGNGAAAAWLAALCPTLVRYSGMVRPYALLGIMVLLTLWCIWEFLNKGRVGAIVGYTACAIGMVYTHHWTWLVLASLNVIALGWITARRQPSDRLAVLTAGNCVVILLYLPWLPSFLDQIQGAGHNWPKSFVQNLSESLWVLSGLPVGQALLILAAFGVQYFGRPKTGLRVTLGRGPLVMFFVGTVVLTGVLAIVLSPVALLFISQCFAMLTPAFLVVLASTLSMHLPRSWPSLAVLLVCLLAFGGQVFVTSQWLRSDMREIGGFLARSVTASDLVLIFPDYPAPTLARYFDPPGEVFTYPRSGFPEAIPFDHRLLRDRDSSGLAEAAEIIDRAAKANRRIWYVTFPKQYPPTRPAFEAILDRLYGEPTCIFYGSPRLRLYEDMMVTLFTRQPHGGSRNLPQSCA